MIRGNMPIRIQTPQVPNFLRTREGQAISVKDLDAELLEAVGKEWTRKLIAKARKRNEQS